MVCARVLVVEDDSLLGALFAHQLGAAGYVVRHVETLCDARAALACEPFQAVVLDLLLPDGNGASLVRELRAGGVPVVVVSRSLDARRALELADLCVLSLPKPVGEAELLGAVGRALACRQGFLAEVEAFGRRHGLARRELELLRAAALGVGASEIAEHFLCAPSTLSSHWRRVFAKTGARTQPAVLAALARFIHERRLSGDAAGADSVAGGRARARVVSASAEFPVADEPGLDEVG